MRLIRDGEKGEGGMEVGERDIIYLSLHCHHQCFVTVRDKVTRQCPQTTTFEEKGEPKQNRIEVPLLTSLTPYHQTGSQVLR